MEYHDNRLCISARELVDSSVMTKGCYEKLVTRKKVDVVRRGGRGGYALIAVSSLPDAYLGRLKALYPDPSMEVLLAWLDANYEVDQNAVAYFNDWRTQSGHDHATDEHVKEYVTNASVLNACIKLYNNARAIQKTMGQKYDWSMMTAAVEGYRVKTGHTLPASMLRFRKKVNEYQRDGYQCLISRKFGNQASRKVDYRTMRLIWSIAVQPNQPFNTSVWEMYNSFVCGELDVYDPETGELFDPSEWTDKVNDSIGELKTYTKAKTEGTALPDIIRSWDNTLPTDNNLFSARRSQQEFLSKKRNDRTKGRITFEQGAVFGQEENGTIDSKGNADLLTIVVRELLRSAGYTGGMTGSGWQLGIEEDLLSHLTIDKITVRRVMNVFELLINKVRSVGGQICVSAANGKIKTAEEQGDYWHITFEQENTFAAHDLMRCQVFTGTAQKAYWVEVAGTADGGILVAKSEFGTSCPEAGDECVLMGNTEVENRQNLVLISASEDGHPRVDVLDGVNAKNFDNALRARFGNLDDIKDDRFPLDNQPKGNGLYADNVYLRGTFLLSTGEDIKTKLEITEGKVQSAIDSVRNDFLAEKGYLNNPTFSSGLDKWNSENETVFFLVGNKWIWANGNVLSQKGDGASVVTDMGRTVVRIRNKYILQKHGNLRYIPTFPTDEDGQKEALPVYLTFFYRCAKAGTLKVCFENVDKTGFANFNSMETSEEIAETDGYVQYTCSGLWNGTGDFRLEFDGDIYLYALVLSTDKVESLAYKYKTLFEQSDRLVKISAAVFDKDENALQETGLMVQPEGTGIYVKDANGKLALIGVGVEETDADGNAKTVVKLTADNIKLEGLVTANQYFKVREDGSIEAVNGKFTGEIRASCGTIGGFTISEDSISTDSDATLQIGGDSFNTHFGISSLTKSVTVQANDNYPVRNIYDFAYKENNRFTLRNTTDKTYDWLNIGVANVMDMDYFSSTSSSQRMPNRYGYQYAMLGTGHVMMDGIVDGGCLSIMSDWSADNQVRMLVPPFEANRVAVSSTYAGDVVVLPNLYSVLSVFGYGIIHSQKKKFSFRMDIVNMGDNAIYIAGRNTGKVNNVQYYAGEELPLLFSNQTAQTNLKGVAIAAHSMLGVLLVYDGTEYQAYIMKSN